MEMLRPPPGHEDDEAPPPPRNRFIRFVFAALFLVIGMVVFFIGGVVVRNPELPNYLLDQIVRHFRGPTTGGTTTGKGYVSSAENLKPPPTPTTPEQYLNLMSYDESTLPSDERAAASVINQTVAHVEEATFARSSPELALLFSKQIIPGIGKLQPGGNVTEIRGDIEKCRVKANTIIRFYQDLARKLIAAGVSDSLAHQTGELFAKRARSELNISSAAEINQACNSVTTMVDLLSKNPSKWKRNSEGNVLFTTEALYDQFNAASLDLNSAIKALNGG